MNLSKDVANMLQILHFWLHCFCSSTELASTGEKEWYFYCPRDRKYRNSVRPNRVTAAGFWKATGTDRPIYSSEGTKCIGLKKSLVFYKGRAARGMKTDWMMHEFRLPSLNDPSLPKRPIDKTIPLNVSTMNSYCAVQKSWIQIFCPVFWKFFFCATNRTPGPFVGFSRRPAPWRNERCRTPGGHCQVQLRQRCSLRSSQCKLQSLLWRAPRCKLHNLHLQASSPADMAACKVSSTTRWTIHLQTDPHASSSTSTAASPKNPRTSPSAASLSKCKHRRRPQPLRQCSSAHSLAMSSVGLWSIPLQMPMAASVAGARTHPPGSLAMAWAWTAVTGMLWGGSTSLLILVQILQRTGGATYPGSPSWAQLLSRLSYHTKAVSVRYLHRITESERYFYFIGYMYSRWVCKLPSSVSIAVSCRDIYFCSVLVRGCHVHAVSSELYLLTAKLTERRNPVLYIHYFQCYEMVLLHFQCENVSFSVWKYWACSNTFFNITISSISCFSCNNLWNCWICPGRIAMPHQGSLQLALHYSPQRAREVHSNTIHRFHVQCTNCLQQLSSEAC